MRFSLLVIAAMTYLSMEVHAQQNQKKFDDFVKSKPAVGDSFPELTVHTPDGKLFYTADLRGHYTVITFGCLT